MEKKTFSKFELARFKRTAQNVDQFLTRKNRLVTGITRLEEELKEVNKMIELSDALTKEATGGYGTEDIIKKVTVITDKLDKNGNFIKKVSYEFIYPKTIVPSAEEDKAIEGGKDTEEKTDHELIPGDSFEQSLTFNEIVKSDYDSKR